jgi:hypothetical protein
MEMTEEEARLRNDLIEHLLERPFKPFTMWMRDGTRHDIVRRLQAAIGMTRGRIVNEAMTDGTNFHIRDVQSISPQDQSCSRR